MKIFIATQETQGLRKSDQFECRDGEPVDFAFICQADEILVETGQLDEGCGCARGMVGFFSFNMTTTFTVVESKLSVGQYIGLYIDSMTARTWIKPEETNVAMFMERATELLRIAAMFHVGQVLEKRGPLVCIRKFLTTPQSKRH